MSTTTQDSQARVIVAEDRSSAALCVPPGLPREQLTVGYFQALLQDRRVEFTAAVEANVAELVQRLRAQADNDTDADTGARAEQPPAGEPIEHIVARATDPVDGDDGWVEWFVEAPAEQAPDDEQPADFYQRSPYIMVEAGQCLGQLHEPTLGADGRDVTGATRPARPGKRASWSFDASIVPDSQGRLIAQSDGMLVRQQHKARVTQVLEVNDHVDFSTGHIDFDGDVLVAKGIRDRFQIHAAGSVEVRGLIEAAQINCGANLVALGGVAARERGGVHVQGDLIARYLDGVTGRVAGDVRVDREIKDAQLEIDGQLVITGGSVFASELAIGGRIEAATLGSPAATPTRFVLGALPSLLHARARLQTILERAEQRREQLEHEQAQLTAQRRPTPADRERQTELTFEIMQLTQLTQRAADGRDRIDAALEHQQSQYDVHITRTLHQRVRFVIGSDAYTIDQDVPGPLRIGPDEHGQPTLRQGHAPARPLSHFATFSPAA